MTVQDNLSARLENCYTGIIHDVMRKMGLENFVLPSSKLRIEYELPFSKAWIRRRRISSIENSEQ